MHWPENYELRILEPVYNQIRQFYRNVHKKYRHVYGKEQIRARIINSFNAINKLYGYKLLSDPILEKWNGMGRVVIGKWHFAINIKGNKVIVADACHEQNMTNQRNIVELFEEDLNTPQPRITGITFPPSRNNRHFIRCRIDGEQQFLKEIPIKVYQEYKDDKLTRYQLAEQCYAKELAQERFPLDEFLYKGRKPQ